MSRGGPKITRADGDYEYASGSAAPHWLEQVAADLETKQQRTAVEVARDRVDMTSFVDRINSIMGGGKLSPYSSVDEAVQDYQKRTGLADFQKAAMASMAGEVVAAGKKKVLSNANDEIDGIISGNDEGPQEALDSEGKPEILDRMPTLEHYIRNVVETQHGVQLPAIVHGIMETFGRDIRESDIDGDVLHWINDLLKNKLKDRHHDNDFALGRGVGTEPTTYDLNDSNRDAFVSLMPTKLV